MKTPRDRFLSFLTLREEMRVSRELIGGDGPHSPDPILAAHRFCNINREHDGVTKYIHSHFRVPFYSRGRTFMVRQMLFCRIFNEPATLDQVQPYDNASTAAKALKAWRKADHKLMRGAYMMPPHGKGEHEKDIVDHWLHVVEMATGITEFPVKAHDYTYDTKLEQVAEKLLTVNGIGPFIANQVVTDLRYMPVWGRSYTDWDEFILCGPGTRRGMNRYFDRPLDFAGTDAKFTAELLGIREELYKDLSETIKMYFIDPNNLSNSFCEFDKWERGHLQLAQGKEVTLRRYAQPDKQLTLNGLELLQ